jgi:asparagine synthase (glutamine-hydrolysing)
LFAAVLNFDGTPVDPQKLAGAGDFVEIVGASRRVAFICSRPEPEAAGEESCGIQSLGGRYWIVGRIRLDAGRELRSRLAARLGSQPDAISDLLLCLHAYAAWGENFVDFLAGDFCFALWDDERSRLICARDQLGVRSLFHAEAGNSRFVGDSLDWIVSHAPADRDLDDYWIADFLSGGHSLDFDRTVYRHIRRIPPAHVLTFSDGGASVRRYWRLEIGEPLQYRDRRQYSERFLELMSRALADRLPAGRVGISMSGGLDSTTLAACAVRSTGDASRVLAECIHYERLMPDDEKHFSSLAARHLGIELQFRAADDLTYDPQWRSRAIGSAEPSLSIICAHPNRIAGREQAGRARVWLHGEGPDNALVFERGPYFSWLLQRRDWPRIAEAAWLYVAAKGFKGWAETLRRYVGRRAVVHDPGVLPSWLDRTLVDRLDLAERIRSADAPREPRHPWHPRAVAWFGDPVWQSVFADFDFEESLAPIFWRHPYLDLRVLEFMLSVPPVPWAREKLLLREAMRGVLPEPILARRKTPLAESPRVQPIRTHGLPGLSRNDRLSRYVDVRALPLEPPPDPGLDRLIAVHALDHWLTQRAL